MHFYLYRVELNVTEKKSQFNILKGHNYLEHLKAMDQCLTKVNGHLAHY